MKRWTSPAAEVDPVHYASSAQTIDGRAWVTGVCGVTDSAPVLPAGAATRKLATTVVEQVTCGACRRVIRERSTP